MRAFGGLGRPSVVALSFVAVVALLLGAWLALRTGSGSVSAEFDRPSTPEATSFLRFSAVDPADESPAAAEARKRNLDELANQRQPLETAVRSVVGPQMSRSDLSALVLRLNLICQNSSHLGGLSTADATAHLVEGGLSETTAKALIEKVCPIT